MVWIYDQKEWPKLTWQRDTCAALLSSVRHEQGRLLGRMEDLGLGLRQEASLNTLTSDVLKSSEIEGERLDQDAVRSSIARKLGLEAAGLKPLDREVEGIVKVTLDATGNYAQALTRERLFDWHSALFPTGRSGMSRIAVGAWRDDGLGPMQVVSGGIGVERVHFEAPAANRVEREMDRFLAWFNGTDEPDWVAKAALAHLRFVTIHPFDDGNGRIARAIADMALARSEHSPQRFYSMSAQIRTERAAYYRQLERSQHGTTDVSGWMQWFLHCLGHAIEGAQVTLSGVLERSRFWKSVAEVPLNERQRFMLARLLEGFHGKLTSSKWATLSKCSQDTAGRDLGALVEWGILRQSAAGGRSTSYELTTRTKTAA